MAGGMINMNIADNLKHINENVAKAALKSGRQPSDITVIGVTKTIDAQVLASELDVLLESGICNFGENRVQELTAKQPVLGDKIKWHMIGSLQRNKVKFVVGQVVLIHSLDSLRLAEEINRIAGQKGVVADVLIEVNIGSEESKHGIATENVMDFAKEVMMLPNLSVKGLMTIAPFVDNPEENRGHFKKMAELFANLKTMAGPNGDIQFLSMGMTGDYGVAIEEGANMVRIGTGIFGERV
jgi:pyridoxal phosphate enzyme (YggS family)